MASAAAGVPAVVVCSGDYQQQQAAVESSTSLHRRSANYQASTWDYDSICSLREEEAGESVLQLQATTLKERVRRLLLQEREDDDTAGRSRLGIIHRLQSLGIAYHFQEEIKGILLSMHRAAPSNLDDDLHSAALLFRMLRAQGIPASTDMLLVMMRAYRFREEDEVVVGSDDDDGLLALYEASYLAFPGETELEEARAFAVQSLAARGGGIAAGHLPLHWRAPRLQAMWSLHEEQAGADDDDDDILQLARVDFNLLQALHRRELAEVTRWWKESRLGERLPFAGDRVVECFFCAACIAPEPHLADCREVLAKTGSLIVHLDDIYDVYGTPEELRAFTDAIATWESSRNSGTSCARPSWWRLGGTSGAIGPASASTSPMAGSPPRGRSCCSMRSPPQERQPSRSSSDDAGGALLHHLPPLQRLRVARGRVPARRRAVGDRLLHGGGLVRRRGAGPRRRPGPHRRHLEGIQQGDVVVCGSEHGRGR